MQQQCSHTGLADLPPGPALGAALADLDLAELTADELVGVLRAWSRQQAHTQARMLRVVAAVAERSREVSAVLHPGDDAVGEWAGAEIAAALTWTDRKAARELDIAEALCELFPDVLAEFDAGRIDYGKAWTFVDVLGPAELTTAQLARICGALLPLAPALTTGQLRARLLRVVLRVDAQYAARRYRRAVRARGVHGHLAADGSGVITGSGLAADEAIAACERVDTLVAAVRRAGHPGGAGQLAADVFVRLLDGRFQGMSEQEIVTALLDDPSAFPATSAGEEDAPTPDAAGHDAIRPAVADPDVPVSGRVASGSGSGVEVRVGLATVLGLDEAPGEVPGWGPVLPDVARLLVDRQHGGEWRFAITGDDGHLMLAGITRRRPVPFAIPPPRQVSGGIVELHITVDRLLGLAGTTTGVDAEPLLTNL